MNDQNNSASRRKFIKNVINASAVSAVPLGALAKEPFGQIPEIKERESGLPLRIMMKSKLSEPFLEKLLGISPDIELIEEKSDIGRVNAWFGSINAADFHQASNLRWVQSISAGVESYLFPEMVQSDVVLTNAAGCSGPCIAEHVFGLLFGLTRNIAIQTRNMNNGKWEGMDSYDIIKLKNDVVSINGMTMGIVGLGGNGSQIARRARAMGMKVIAVDILPKYNERIGSICDEIRLVQDDGLTWLLNHSDVVVLAAPHTRVSEGMMGEEQFAMMKKSAYFINIARGKLVKTSALVAALKSEQIVGAGLDVVDPEPLPKDHELWKFPNVVLTSHIAYRSQYSQDTKFSLFVENVQRYVNGHPLINVVDKEMGF